MSRLLNCLVVQIVFLIVAIAIRPFSVIMQAHAFASVHRQGLPTGKRLRAVSSSAVSAVPKHVAIVGGGLAGLSTAYHLVHKSPDVAITILDGADPGCGGSSAVAGGFLHPLSPKGKLVHLGLEGLSASNELIDAAAQFRSDSVLRNEIFRVAIDENHVQTLQATAKSLPDLTEWISPEDLPWRPPPKVMGALRLHSGCKVVHVPTYLQGLWESIVSQGSGKKEWIKTRLNPCSGNLSADFKNFDAVVLAAGSGLVHDSIVTVGLPAQLVRGQSIEMELKESTIDHAMLCGKYVSPLVEDNRVLIGATHEFKEDALDVDGVKSELETRSNSFVPELWENGVVEKVTSGYRVQSNRGKYGRMPILGKMQCPWHHNPWIFTGLSSRGLLLHGVFGEILASQILDLQPMYHHPDLDWWRSKTQV